MNNISTWIQETKETALLLFSKAHALEAQLAAGETSGSVKVKLTTGKELTAGGLIPKKRGRKSKAQILAESAS